MIGMTLPLGVPQRWLTATRLPFALLLAVISLSSLHRSVAQQPALQLAGKTIYFLVVDRFARTADDDASGGAADASEQCSGHDQFCGGTLRGVIAQLDYIQGMGFDCVWITPVVKQPDGLQCTRGSGDPPWCGVGYHGYWTEDFYAIDRRFGTSADLQALSRTLKSRGMCLVLDIVTNHVRPLNELTDLRRVRPFNRSSDFHSYKRAWNESFVSYLRHPHQCFPPPPCQLGDLGCRGYDETAVSDGWFYNLADLDQEQPRVAAELLQWVGYMVRTYQPDALRLDTAAYMRLPFLRALRRAAGVPVLGEVTSGNETFLRRFLQAEPRSEVGQALDGLYDFRMFGGLYQGFCGNRSPCGGGSGGSGGHSVGSRSVAVARGQVMTLTVLRKDPRIVQIDGFLSAAEAATIVALARAPPSAADDAASGAVGDASGSAGSDKSSWLHSSAEGPPSDDAGRVAEEGTRHVAGRTSRWCCVGNEHEVLAAAVERAAWLTGLSPAHAEACQVVWYRAGEQYAPHVDHYTRDNVKDAAALEPSGNRLISVFVYLAAPYVGGCTTFPLLGLSVAPVAGTALLWHNLDKHGVLDGRTLHCGEPVASGEKLGMNIWLRQRPHGDGVTAGSGGAWIRAPPPQSTAVSVKARETTTLRERFG